MLDPNSPDKMKLNPIYQVAPSDALKLYAYASQATYGDVTGEQPSIFDIKNRALYDAWAECRGMSKHEAKQHFIDFATNVLNSHGIDTSDPLKAQKDAEYEQCLKDELARAE